MELLLQLGVYPDDISADTLDVGLWNSVPQDNNTWNDPAALRAVRKITGQVCGHHNTIFTSWIF